MAARKPSLFRRFVRFVFFRFVPVLILVLIIWSAYQVGQAFVRQIDERSDYEQRSASFAGTATAIAQAVTDVPPTPPITPIPTDTLEPTATNTAEPTVTDTRTLTSTATLEPTLTPTNTPEPSPTLTETPVPTDTIEPTDSMSSAFQFGATNTPRPVTFATNTPVSDIVTEVPSPTPTNTPEPPTVTPPPPTDMPSLTPTYTSTATPASRAEPTHPLPTLLAPLEPPEGLVLNGTAVPTRVPPISRDYDLTNIVLLGGDDELVTDGTIRTDTMVIVSINRDTHTVSMLSLPRDLFVYVPTPSGLMQRINVVYGIGENIGYTDGGFGLLRQTIWYNLGLNVHYYARVNFSGFEEIIDTLGGVEIAVDCAYQDYPLLGAEVPDSAVKTGEDGLVTLPVGYYEMDGSQALWYVRTRHNSSDFDRGRRQQQLLRAMWQKAKDTGMLANLPQLWGQVTDIVETDMGLDDVIGLLPIALDLNTSRIETYTMQLRWHTQAWQPPDGSFVQLPIYDEIHPLMEDFYRPPTESQLLVEGATIAVYNGTENPNWDRVAAERLIWEGFPAVAMGPAENRSREQTVLIDYTGQQKGSSRDALAQILNVRPEGITDEPDPNRSADFSVILGADYNSCNASGVLPVEEE